MSTPLTKKEQQDALEAALDEVGTCYDVKRAMDPKTPDVLAEEAIGALHKAGLHISSFDPHVWDKRTKVSGQEQCSRCNLIRRTSMAGNTILGYSYYRASRYVGDDVPGPIPSCDERRVKK